MVGPGCGVGIVTVGVILAALAALVAVVKFIEVIEEASDVAADESWLLALEGVTELEEITG